MATPIIVFCTGGSCGLDSEGEDDGGGPGRSLAGIPNIVRLSLPATRGSLGGAAGTSAGRAGAAWRSVFFGGGAASSAVRV
jgi:hypothetical protein